MPENRKEEIVFTLMMACGMVLVMSCYNALYHLGWNGPWLLAALQNFSREYILAVPVAYFIGSPITKRITEKVWPWKRYFFIGMGIFTPCIMAPLMTTLIHLLFLGVTDLAVLLPAYARNLPGAMAFQLFLVGPVVRRSFRSWKTRFVKRCV